MTGFEAHHPRAAAGASDGGRFVTAPRREANVDLTAERPRPDPFSDERLTDPAELLDALHAACLTLMAEHGLGDWQLQYTATVSHTLGRTHHARRTITLSAPQMLALDGAGRLDTIRHEMAHALLPATENHGPAWRRKARQLGACPEPTAAEQIGADQDQYPIVGTCPAGHSFGRNRMPAPTRRFYCTTCRGPSDERRAITWKRTDASPDPAIAAAVARYATARPAIRLRIGEEVSVRPVGSKFDGQRGQVVKTGRTNVTLRTSTGRLLQVPIEAVEVDA